MTRSLLTKKVNFFHRNFFRLALIVFCTSFFVFTSGIEAKASTASSYWKTYFSAEEKKAVQKNAEKYTLSEIKKKSKDWHNVFTGFNIKNGSISNDDIESINAVKIKHLDDTISEQTSGKLDTSGGTLSGLLIWASGQTFDAGSLTGAYAALNGSQITGITAGQVGAVSYSGATGSVDLNEKNLVNLGNVGIGTTAPLVKLHIGNGATNNSVDSQVLISRLVDDTVTGNGHAFSDSSNITRGGTIGYNSFDARVNFSGTANYDHYAAFQVSPTYSSSGTISNVYGLYTKGTITSGTITNNYGVYADSPLYTAGTMTNNWGIYVAPQVAATNNYAAAFMGKVGIGNSTPAVALDVLGANPRMYLADSATGYSMLKMYSTVAGSALYLGHESNAGGAVLTGSAANSGVLLTGGAYPLHFGTNGVLRMTIDGTNGNVGIGNVVPGARLDIKGSTADGSTNILSWQDSNGLGLGAIKTNGNVGIGTTTPVAALDVNGQVKMKVESAQPFACDTTHSGTIALTSAFRTCVCKGPSATWVFTADGTTACTW